MKAHFRRTHKNESEIRDEESILVFEKSIMNSMKHISKLNTFNLVTSKNSAFQNLSNQVEQPMQQYKVKNILLIAKFLTEQFCVE